MLKKVDLKSGSIAQTTFGEAEYPAPFAHTLEYSAASRGPWNIAHSRSSRNICLRPGLPARCSPNRRRNGQAGSFLQHFRAGGLRFKR